MESPIASWVIISKHDHQGEGSVHNYMLLHQDYEEFSFSDDTVTQ